MTEMETAATYAELLESVRRRLRGRVESPAKEAERLIAEAGGPAGHQILVRPAQPVDRDVAALVEAWSQRRAEGVPFAYVVGLCEFYGRRFEVGPEVLIPRMETEVLIEVSLRRCPLGAWLDVGAGSGAVALTLAMEQESPSTLFASDVSAAALRVARRNVARHDLGERVHLIRTDLLSGLTGLPRLTGIVANLPYVSEEEWWRLEEGVRKHEPRSALVPGGGTARDLRRRLINQARAVLVEDGCIALEVGAGQAGEARADLLEARFCDVTIDVDLSGVGRIVSGRWNRR